MFFKEICIYVPHDGEQNLCFPSHEKKIFWLRKVVKSSYIQNGGNKESVNIKSDLWDWWGLAVGQQNVLGQAISQKILNITIWNFRMTLLAIKYQDSKIFEILQFQIWLQRPKKAWLPYSQSQSFGVFSYISETTGHTMYICTFDESLGLLLPLTRILRFPNL